MGLKPAVYVCDSCGVERKEVNHWFIVNPSTQLGNSMVILPFEPDYMHQDSLCFCGEAHTIKYISEHLSELHNQPKAAVVASQSECICGYDARNNERDSNLNCPVHYPVKVL